MSSGTKTNGTSRSASPGGEQRGNEQSRSDPAVAEQHVNTMVAPPPMAIRDFFRFRPMPWWLVFILGGFLFMKLQIVYNDSPCAVLGTPSPVTSSDVKRSFRAVSMCTHPDRLRGRLKRQPTPAENRRGEIIFKRASAAKDAIQKVLKRRDSGTAACYEGELEMAVYQFFQQISRQVLSLGVMDYVDGVWSLLKSLASFQAGILETLMTVIYIMFIYKLGRALLAYMWRLGLIRLILAIVTTVIIGPLPTVFYFICLPFLRCAAFVLEIRNYFKGKPTDEQAVDKDKAEKVEDASQAGEEKKDETKAAVTRSTAKLEVATDGPSRLRQRKKPATEAEKEKRNRDLQTGKAEVVKTEEPVWVPPVDEEKKGYNGSFWRIVTHTHGEKMRARQEAANAVQFDMLLILTKPIIPFFMLICMGQVWNGVLPSLFVGHVLRRWVPNMGNESHHILCAFFGFVHTILGITGREVEAYANKEGQKMLHLAWSWSLTDVMAIMHMCLLGSGVATITALGNEPQFAASFASGIALRIALGQDSVRSSEFMKIAGSWMDAQLKKINVVVDEADAVVAYSGNGIGDCGGGAFRMIFGDGQGALWASRTFKLWLMILPALALAQWCHRSYIASRMLGKKNKTWRFMQRLVMLCLGAVQVYLFANLELNASNGELINFWVAMLIGCAGESLLCLYDSRGTLRQVLFLLLFLFC